MFGKKKQGLFILTGVFFSLFTPLKGFAETPPPVTDYVEKLASLHQFLVGVSAGACVLVIFTFVYFAIRYRRKSENETGTCKNFPQLFSWSLPGVLSPS